MKTIVELKNVSVKYDLGKSNETVAVKNVSLKIFEGEYIIFLGQSGCGKSTLLYTIAGLESATEGEVIVNGINVREMKGNGLIDFYRNTIGMVFQAFYLVPHLTVQDNIMLSKIFSGVSTNEREKKAKDLMDRFGITPFSSSKPSAISGGQQQRTAIARALMNDPEIILADEPVGNLDTKNANIVLELLASIHKNEKKTIIQVTHNPQDAHYADRVFYMKDGIIEKIVENTEKGKEAGKHNQLKVPHVEMSEIEKLSEVYPNLNKSRLQAKYMMRRLLLPYDIDTEIRIEEIIEKYIKKEINKDELLKLLDEPSGGVGLYAQKAQRVTDSIQDLENEIIESENIRIAMSNKQISTEDYVKSEVEIIRRHLLDNYSGHLSIEQISRLESTIIDRINKKIDNNKLKEILDLPIKNGGLGLNSKTAKRFAEEINMIINK